MEWFRLEGTLRGPCSKPLPKAGGGQPNSKCLQGQRPTTPLCPAAAVDYPHWENFPPNNELELPLLQLAMYSPKCPQRLSSLSLHIAVQAPPASRMGINHPWTLYLLQSGPSRQEVCKSPDWEKGICALNVLLQGNQPSRKSNTMARGDSMQVSKPWPALSLPPLQTLSSRNAL